MMPNNAVRVLLLVFVLTPAAVFAHSGATGVVKERMEMMKGMSSAIKFLNKQVLEQRNLQSAEALEAMQTLIGHSAHLPNMFPEGSSAHPSEASPKIWEKQAEFDRLFADMGELAEKFLQGTQTTDDYKIHSENFTKLVFSCKACHDIFRIKRH